MKVAIVHDWITCPGGAEKVVQAMLEVFPDAHLYTAIYNEKTMGGYFGDTPIYASYLNNMPFAKTKHSMYLKLMPRAFESFNLSGYDVVISSSTSCAKGVLTDVDTLHICYCNTPMRYAWDMYFDYTEGKNAFVRWLIHRMMHKIRIWDAISSDRVDYFIANSKNVARRVEKHYRRHSHVIYPSVDSHIGVNQPTVRGDYYFVLSRLVAYKRIDLAVEAFNKLGKRLIIAGDGPELKNLQKMAKSNIEFVGHISDEEKAGYFRCCRGFIFPGEEDFGITPVEAQSYGKPVIAYGKGGALETVIGNTTGVFFYEQTAEALKKAVEKAEKMEFDEDMIRRNSMRFDKSVFKRQLYEFVMDKYKEFNS